MNAFDQANEIELQGNYDLKHWLENVSDGKYIITSKGRLAKHIQETLGDFIFNDKEENVWTAEAKTEEENKYENFFLETWSNLPTDFDNIDRKNPGWMIKLMADILMYYFKKNKTLYLIDFRRLCLWAFIPNEKHKCRIHDFPLKEQTKYNQKNKTFGHCVPISIIEQEVGFSKLFFVNGQFEKENGNNNIKHITIPLFS
jgi:hypothetical protein